MSAAAHSTSVALEGDLHKDARLESMILPILDSLSSKALRRGADGFLVVERALAARRERKSDARITPEALRDGMTACGMPLSIDEAQLLTLGYRDASGFVLTGPLLRALEGAYLGTKRRQATEALFNALRVASGTSSSTIDLGRCAQQWASFGSDAEARDFGDSFGTGAAGGAATVDELCAFYAGWAAQALGTSAEDDAAFERNVFATWSAALRLAKSGAASGASGAPVETAGWTTDAGMSTIAAASSSATATLGSSHAASKRIVGYTGHVPQAQERFGETFHRIEAATATLSGTRASGWKAPETEFVDRSVSLVRQGNKANKHSFKLA